MTYNFKACILSHIFWHKKETLHDTIHMRFFSSFKAIFCDKLWRWLHYLILNSLIRHLTCKCESYPWKNITKQLSDLTSFRKQTCWNKFSLLANCSIWFCKSTHMQAGQWKVCCWPIFPIYFRPFSLRFLSLAFSACPEGIYASMGSLCERTIISCRDLQICFCCFIWYKMGITCC